MSNIVNKVGDDLQNTLGFAVDELGSAGNLAANTVENVGNFAGNTVKNVGDVALDTVKGASNIVEDATDVIGDTVDDLGKFTQKTIDNVSNTLNVSDILKSPVLYGLIAIFLTMYGPRLQPKLPEPVRNLFNNNYFRFAVILLVAYLSSRNLQLSLIVAIAFCLLTSYASSQEVQENFIDQYREGYSNFDTIRENYSPENMPADFQTQHLLADPEDDYVNVSPTTEGFYNPGSTPELATQVLEEPRQPVVEEFTTTEEEGVSEPNQCKAGLTNNDCVQYCYSQAGFDNEFCKKNFPNPQAKCTSKKLNTVQKRTNCLDAMCTLDANKNVPYCKQSIQGTDDKSSHSSKSSHTSHLSKESFSALDHIKNLASTLGKEVEKYKNPLV